MSRRTSTSIRDFKITNSFSTFFSQKSPASSLHVSKSSFSKFLSHAIAIDSDADITGVMETRHQTIYGDKGDAQIIDSSFSHCQTTGGHGGAILFDSKTLSAKFDRVFFLKCTSTGSGGAFYAFLDNMSVTRTCFDECQALESGHAFFIDLNSQLLTANFSEVTIIHSAPHDSVVGKAAAVFLTGVYRTQLLNCSDNHALSLCAAFASMGATNFTITFNEFMNCTSLNIFKFIDLNQSLVFAFSNFLFNTATNSLILSSSRNNILNSVFLRNEVATIFSGEIEYLQMSDCVMDVQYSFDDLKLLHTPGVVVKPDLDTLYIRFAFAGHCRIVGEREAQNGKEIMNQIIQKVPLDNHKYIHVFGNRLSFEPQIPKPRNLVKTEEPEQAAPEIPITRKTRKRTSTNAENIPIHHPEDIPSSKKSRSSGKNHIEPITIKKDAKSSSKPKAVPAKIMTPSASFSPSETFYKSRTFLPSLQFTASVSPAQSLVPYVLYSAAGFVVFAVLTSFLFLKSTDAGYNLMTPSESADSRISDYASSTSTTVTITGESSSVVV